MNKGYNKQTDAAYRTIFRRVCKDFHLESANFADFRDKAIPKLSKKDRKHLENYFGINGGVNHADKIYRIRMSGKKPDKAEIEMERKTEEIIDSMHSLDYLVLFHKTVQELVEKVARKTTGEENSVEATKWALLYATMVIGGPNFFFDNGWKVQSKDKIKSEERNSIEIARLLEFENTCVFEDFLEEELVIPIVKQWVEDLDVSDRIALLDLFGISKPKYLEEFEHGEIRKYSDLRQMKEAIFYRGRWVTDGFFFLRTRKLDEEVVKQIDKLFELLRRGAKINLAEPEIFPFGTGARDITLYSVDIGEEDTIEFPSIEEIMMMYPLWLKHSVA